MPKRIDITGQKFGHLTAIRPTKHRSASGSTLWVCRCACGKLCTIRIDNLRDGTTQSCGCRCGGYRHGFSRAGNRHALYQTWAGMLARCRNPNATGYELYGGRGITVNKRWYKFENFLADVGERPLGRTLDRIDNNGNYGPKNFRWATKKEQFVNRRIRRIEQFSTAELIAELKKRQA